MIYDSPLKHSLDETKCCIDVQVRLFEPSKMIQKCILSDLYSLDIIIGAKHSQPT